MKKQLSLYEAFYETVKKTPDNHALFWKKTYLTYSALNDLIIATASGLFDLGLRDEDTITMAMPNTFESVIALYAGSYLGLKLHLVHPLTPLHQMRRFMDEMNSNTLVIVDTFYEKYKELVSVDQKRLILASPMMLFPLLMKTAYNLMNRKRLKNIQYNNLVVPFDALLHGKEKAPYQQRNISRDSVFLHSGGTSGNPKTIALSDNAINNLSYRSMYILDESEFKDKAMLAVLPMFHGFGLCMGVHAMLLHGGYNTLMPKYNRKEVLSLLKKGHIHYLIGVPSLYENLISQKDIEGKFLENIRQAFVGGDFTSPDLIQRFDSLMARHGSKAKLLEGYGLTEVVTVCAVNTLQYNKPGTVGKPLPDIKIQTIDPSSRKFLPIGEKGELVILSDTKMNGYMNTLEENQSFIKDDKNQTWVLTGDYGFIDEEGYVHFLQRLKRIVKVSGIPILPSEIESLLSHFEEVTEAVALGVADTEKGNMIVLFVQPSSPEVDRDALNEKIKKNIKAELSVYAMPKEIYYVESFPRTIIGKVDTNSLSKQYLE